MTKTEAKLVILDEMRKRLRKVPFEGASAGHTQFLILKQERPELFRWKDAGDGNHWQEVHIWMREAGLVTQ